MTAKSEQSVLLIIGGGIAAYKSLDLIRRLRERDFRVRTILTKAGSEFVTPLSVSGLAGEKVFTDLFDLTDESEMGHIQLSRSADLLVVAPATADFMAKMVHGHASDLASTAVLATDKPVLIAPAMNVRMWEHAATQRNLGQLVKDGVHIVGPNSGDMACGEFGPGRMAEPLEIVSAVQSLLSQEAALPLSGRKALVTSGPTHEPIDPVRYIANRSSGKQGYAIAEALALCGAETTLISGPTNLSDPRGVNTIRVETAREMLAACEAALPVDIAICAAAVADWRADHKSNQKIKKNGGATPSLDLVENPDILKSISGLKKGRPDLVVGFAAETENVIDYAKAKLKKKGCDWIVANDVSPGTGIMGGDRNTVHVIRKEGTESWAEMTKQEVGTALVKQVAQHFGAKA